MIAEQKRVLVVEDDCAIRDLLCTVLRDRGLDVDEAGDEGEALDLIAARAYSVIVLDLVIPIVDGMVLAEKLSRLEPRPVVLVVSGAEPSPVDWLDPLAVHGIVRKPFDTEELASVVSACAEIRSRSSLQAMALAILAGGSLLAMCLPS